MGINRQAAMLAYLVQAASYLGPTFLAHPSQSHAVLPRENKKEEATKTLPSPGIRWTLRYLVHWTPELPTKGQERNVSRICVETEMFTVRRLTKERKNTRNMLIQRRKHEWTKNIKKNVSLHSFTLTDYNFIVYLSREYVPLHLLTDINIYLFARCST